MAKLTPQKLQGMTSRILKILASLFLVVGIILAALKLILDTERLAARIQNDLRTKADISLSYDSSLIQLYPWPNLVLENVAMASERRKGISLQARQLRFDIKNLLFSRRLSPELDRAIITVDPADKSSASVTPRLWLDGWIKSLLHTDTLNNYLSSIRFNNAIIRYSDPLNGIYEYLYSVKADMRLSPSSLSLALSALWRGETFAHTITLSQETAGHKTENKFFEVVTNLTTDFGAFTYDGTLSLTPFFLGEGRFTTHINDVRRFERWRERLSLNRFTPLHLSRFSAEGQIDFRDDRIKLSDSAISLNGFKGQGNLTFGNKAYLQATLHFPKLAPSLLLAPLLVNQKLEAELSKNLLSATAWRNMNLDLRLSVDRMDINELTISPLIFTVISKNGTTNIAIGHAGLAKGTLGARITVQALDKGIESDIQINVKDIDIQSLAEIFNEKASLSSTLNTQVQLTASGATKTDWQSSINGHIKVNTGPLTLLNYDLESWYQVYLENPNNLSLPPKGQTAFEPSTLSLQLNHGKIILNRATITTPSLHIGSTGTIDIKDKELDILTELRGLPEDNTEAPLNLRFDGTLDAPRTNIILENFAN